MHNESAEAPIVLIDAYSQIFRSYYAVRRLTDGDGNPVNALYVFTRLLLELPVQISKWRWLPVELPVEPTYPMIWPWATV